MTDSLPNAAPVDTATVQPAFDPSVARRLALNIVPPPELLAEVGVDERAAFERVGDEFLGYLVDLAGLQPAGHVLEIGCGCGQLVIPLTGYLGSGGRYDGVDVWQAGVEWCRQNIGARRPAFQFERLDVWHARHNIVGPSLASDVVWPYPDGTFDVVVAASAFTHLMPRDAAHYVAEAARVLKPGGRCLLAWYLLDEAAREKLAAGSGPLAFKPHPIYGERCLTLDPTALEETVAYDPARVTGYCERSGLTIAAVHPGRWSGRPDGLSELDLVLATKPIEDV